MESPDTTLPSFNTPTHQTIVLVPFPPLGPFLDNFSFSTTIFSTTLPLLKSHFLKQESEHPVASQESDHSSSSSSSSSSSESESEGVLVGLEVVVVVEGRRVGGPQAMERRRVLVRSKRRRWVRSESSRRETSRREPSSQPRARRVEDGLGARDQRDPDWVGRRRYCRIPK